MNAKGLALEVGADPGAVARADREKVQQIVINLLSNAIKFTPSGGRVRVDAGRNGPGAVRLAVADTGIGIPKDKQVSVFDPFVQVDMSRTRRSEGSGLGLAISRDLARGMGGDLTVASTPGEGSTFTLTLPSED
jgi:signal transduction histidine kinase